jgi:hypothetical protein
MPPKFLLTPNEQTSKDTPRSYRNQLIPETASDLLPKIIADASSFNYNTDPSYDEVRVIKVFEPTDPPKAGSSLALSTEFEQNKPPTISHCMAISVGKTHRNMPLPEEVGNNITDPKSITLTKMSMYCFDTSGVLKQPLKVGDKLPVHKISALEARITGIPTGNNITQAEADEISAREAAAAANGGTVGDDKQTTSPTGDQQSGGASNQNCNLSTFLTTLTPKNLSFNNQICGNERTNSIDSSIVYKTGQCRTDVLPNGQTISLQSIFFDQVSGLITDMINDPEIIASGYKVAISSGYRTLDGQKYARRLNCPEAVKAGATEQELYYDKWVDLKAKYNCKGAEASPAVRTTSHLTGMAVDFVLDYQGGYSNAEAGKPCYDFVRANSLIYKIINKYATKHKLVNYSKEPWHWSTDGR